MDFLTFLSNVINSLAWPSSMVFALWLFRTPLSNLIEAIKRAKFKYETNGTKVEAELDAIRNVVDKHIPDKIKELVHKEPVKAIKEAWHDLEETATSSIAISKPISISQLADDLVVKKILSEPEAKALYKLHELKDIATKGYETITEASSGSYASTAYALSEIIKKKKT